MSNAKTFLLLASQKESFQNEIRSLSNKRFIAHKSRLRNLKPFLDADNCLRAEGRLHESPFDYCLKHPIILDGHNRIIQLFIEFVHSSNGHTHLKQTQHILQLEYWILSAGSVIKKIIRRCFDCRRQSAFAEFPEMSDLPIYRFPIEQPFPFQQTGLDVFGPFASKTTSHSYNKRYGLILTCLTTRAVHLEMCTDLSVDACMKALCRFFSRRGKPHLLISDNGTNFTASEKELLQIFNQPSIQEFFGKREIRWIFNPPRAPHFGGVWERLIRSCKDAFYAILGNNALTDDTFNNLLCEVEHFMNNRPLTAVSSDSGDIEPLTPNHFLLGRAYSNVPLSQPYPSPATISKQWKFAQQLADYLWNRLQKEFYPSLIPRQKWTVLSKPLQPGSIVWILQEFTPRGL